MIVNRVSTSRPRELARASSRATMRTLNNCLHSHLRNYIEVPEEASCNGVSPATGRTACTHKNDVDDLSELQSLAVVPVGK